MPLWGEFFLLLVCGGFVALGEVSGERRYGVVRLRWVVSTAMPLALAKLWRDKEGRRLDFSKLRSALPTARRASLWERRMKIGY